MRYLLFLCMVPCVLSAQIANISGVNGLGYSTYQCVDRDGDGYGVGTLAVINTSVSGGISAGTQTVTPGSLTGISTGTTLRIGLGTSQERVTVLSTLSGTFTARFAYAHSAGVSVMDQGCLGPDADDLDATVHTEAQIATKYGNLTNSVAKVNRDDDGMVFVPSHIWYISTNGSDSTCAIDNASLPCATYAHVSGSLVSGEAVMWRGGTYSEVITPIGGASSTSRILYMSYPGETATWNMSGGNIAWQALDVSNIIVDGIKVGGATGVCINGGSSGFSGASTSQNVTFRHIEGYSECGLGTIQAINGLTNWTIEDSVFHDNDCGFTVCQHGVYLGSDEIPSSNVILRRNIFYNNDWNGLHFNGRVSGLVVTQNVAYGNGVSGLDFEMGVKGAVITSNLVFNNAKQITFFNYDSGQCTSVPPGVHAICPFEQTSNLIAYNTLLVTGNFTANPANAGSSPDPDCVSGVTQCDHPAIVFNNATAASTGSFGLQIIRDNIIATYGNNNRRAAIAWESTPGSCNIQCQAWASSSTVDTNLFYQMDGLTTSSGVVVSLGGGDNAGNYTCATAGTVVNLSGCVYGDPQFIAGDISKWATPTYFDLRVFNASPAVHAGVTTTLSSHDLVGRAYVDGSPTVGALERNLYQVGWNTLTGAGYTSAASPANGAPSNTSCLTSQGLFTATPPCTSAQGYPFSGLYSSEFTAWTDGFLREHPNAHWMCWWGGGHSDYVGNEIYCIKFGQTSPAIALVDGPHQYFGGQSGSAVADWANCPAALADGSPNTTHSAGTLVYDPVNDAFSKTNGAPACGGGHQQYDTFVFSFGSGTWSQKDGPTVSANCTDQGTGFSSCTPYPSAITPGHQIDIYNWFQTAFANGNPQSGFGGDNIYDPLTHTYWIYLDNGSGFSSIYQYYPAVNQFVARTGSFEPALQQGNAGIGANRVFISNRRWWLHVDWVSGSSTLTAFYYDMSANTSTTPVASPNLTRTPITLDASCYAWAKTTSPGMVFDPILDRVIAYPAASGGDTYYLLDPATWTCTAVSTYSGGPPTSPLTQYVYGKMQKSQDLDAVVLVNDVGANTPRVLNLNGADPVTPCQISPTSLGPWTVGQTPISSLTEGGCNNATFGLTGTWPTGLSGCSSGAGPTCSLSGTLSASGTFTPTVSYSTASNPYTIVVNPAPAMGTCGGLSAPTCPNGSFGVAYSTTIATSGGTAPVNCAITSGALPAGLAISGCVVSGTPSFVGTASFTLTPSDSNGISGAGVAYAITISSGSLPSTIPMIPR